MNSMNSASVANIAPSISWSEVHRGPTQEQGQEQDDDVLMVGASPIMGKVRAYSARVARVHVPVLLVGESGVGKEVAARLIHRLSPRSHRTFLKVNCAALPCELLESELFGYEAGAFTGATRPKPGRFELCDKGTILLDEIAEMPPASQAKLLQVLQEGQFSRLGGRSSVKVDVRILAATNVNIQQALENNLLRQDLYYRLSTFTLCIPPLRERLEDIPVLLDYFLQRFAAQLNLTPKQFSSRVMQACLQHPWPGNVRELENFVRRYLVLEDEEAALAELGHESGNGRHKSAEGSQPGVPFNGLKSMVRTLKTEAEKEAILRALLQTGGQREEAARLLKISRRALAYKMLRYGFYPGKSGNGAQVPSESAGAAYSGVPVHQGSADHDSPSAASPAAMAEKQVGVAWGVEGPRNGVRRGRAPAEELSSVSCD